MRMIDADIIAEIIRLLPTVLDVSDDERAAFEMAAWTIEQYAETNGIEVK